MSDYGRLQDERDALLVENDRLRARVAELEGAAVLPTGDNQMVVDVTTDERPDDPEASRGREPEGFAAMSETADRIADEKPPEPVDWDAVHKAETDKVIADGQPNG